MCYWYATCEAYCFLLDWKTQKRHFAGLFLFFSCLILKLHLFCIFSTICIFDDGDDDPEATIIFLRLTIKY